jgi:hypothetical protein
MGNVDVTPRILNSALDGREWSDPHFGPFTHERPVSTGYEARRAQGSV